MPPAAAAPSPGGGAATPPSSKPQSPLRITHEGEFYARLLTRESSLVGNPSFRYYGAGTGAVPFVWESQPGTPKDASYSAAAVAPVITPPPSYYLHGHGVPIGHTARRHRHGRSGGKCCGYYKLKWVKLSGSFVATVFRRLAFGKPRPSSTSSATSVRSSSSSSTRWLFSGSGAAAEARDLQEYCCGYDDGPAAHQPRTTKGVLCLGIRRPSPWMVQLCGGSHREQDDGWAAYGWRP